MVAKPATANEALPQAKQRILNVVIPEDVYWHAREMALQSRRPFKNYVAEFLKQAHPIPLALLPTEQELADLAASTKPDG